MCIRYRLHLGTVYLKRCPAVLFCFLFSHLGNPREASPHFLPPSSLNMGFLSSWCLQGGKVTPVIIPVGRGSFKMHTYPTAPCNSFSGNSPRGFYSICLARTSSHSPSDSRGGFLFHLRKPFFPDACRKTIPQGSDNG